MVILGADALCVVVRFVFKVAERECPRAEAVLSRSCFACNDRALEAGVFLDVDVEAAQSCKDACLLSCASVVGEDIPLAYARIDGRLAVLLRALDTAHVPREIEACRCVLLLVGFFFLQGLDMEIAADLCRDLVALHCAAEDVCILAAFDLQGVFGGDLCLLSISTTNH